MIWWKITKPNIMTDGVTVDSFDDTPPSHRLQQLSLHLFLWCCAVGSPVTAGTTAGTGTGHLDLLRYLAGRLGRREGWMHTHTRKNKYVQVDPSLHNVLMQSLGKWVPGLKLTYGTQGQGWPLFGLEWRISAGPGCASWAGCTGETLE